MPYDYGARLHCKITAGIFRHYLQKRDFNFICFSDPTDLVLGSEKQIYRNGFQIVCFSDPTAICGDLESRGLKTLTDRNQN